MSKIILLIACVLLVAHIEYKDTQARNAAITCQDQTPISTPTYAECVENQFEKNSDK